MKLTLIRHSKTIVQPEVNNLNWVLSNEGVELAKELAQDRQIMKLDVLYSSLQNKALETAVLLAKPENIPIRTHADLTESTSITNKFFGNYEETVGKYLRGELKSINGGDLTDEAYKRFIEALSEIAKQEPTAQNIGIVSHGVLLSIFTSRHSELAAEQVHKSIQMPDYAIFDWDTKKFDLLFSKFR